MPDAYICGRLWRTKITPKASDEAEYIELFGSFTRDRHARQHIYRQTLQRITINASCMTISGERTEQLDIFCCVTGFTSDFLSFIDVELIRFFHGALPLTCLFYYKTITWVNKYASFISTITLATIGQFFLILSLLDAGIKWNGAVIKLTTSPQICCHTTSLNLSN